MSKSYIVSRVAKMMVLFMLLYIRSKMKHIDGHLYLKWRISELLKFFWELTIVEKNRIHLNLDNDDDHMS